MYTKRRRIMRKFTSCSLICDTTYIECDAVKKGAKIVVFSLVFRSDALIIGCTANRRPGGESTHNSASFLYTSFCCVIKSQILNCARCFDGVILGPKEGKRGESVLENIFYRVNNKFYRVNTHSLNVSRCPVPL